VATPDSSADIGARLRAARERKGLTILQSAEKLHMDARLLEALESGDFASLGAAVYVRGHLRRYAELVGESSSELQGLYAGTAPGATPDLTRIPRAGSSPRSSQLLLPGLIAIVMLALVGVVWWLVSLPRTKVHPLSAATQPLTAPSLAPAGSAAPVPDLTDGGAPTTAPAAVVPDNQVHLELKFAEASWIRIWDAKDKPLADGMMASGTTRTIDGAPPLRLVIGNAHAVGLAVNGQVVNLDAMVRRRGDARITVEAGGRVSRSASAPTPGGE
jgi:cytoskeleton protein RodZ